MWQQCVLGLLHVSLSCALLSDTVLRADETDAPQQLNADLLIVGGTESGWAAAIQAARMDVPRIVLVLDGTWLGGQFTEQALACVDENKGNGRVGWGVDWHPMKRSFHRSGLFRELMDRIEAANETRYGTKMPGRPFHGPSTFRPAEAQAVFAEMLQPWIDSGQVQLFHRRYPVASDVEMQNGRRCVTAVHFRNLETEANDLSVTAKLTIDASDWGDVIQVSGTDYECGPDPQARYGEPSAPPDAASIPHNEMNPITWAMIVEESGEETPIPRPPRFDDRNYPRATHLSLREFRQLPWDHPSPGLGAIAHWPDVGKAAPRQLSVFNVRRVVDGTTSHTGRTVILLNYMNGQDYPLERLPQHVADALEATEPGASQKNIVEMTRDQREIIFEDARQHALGVLYHLQNFVHERASDRTHSFRRFQLSREFGTDNHLPPKPYIRESLRLRAMYMMREQDGRNRDGVTKDNARERFAHVMYPDGVLPWQFHYDFHRTGRTYLKSEGSAGPWIDFHKPNRHTNFVSDRSVFPLRSLIPWNTDGLLGAQKNLGYSSIVSAAIRLHDQCIAIGQAAGAAAAVALQRDIPPRDLVTSPAGLSQVRNGLCGGVPNTVPMLIWPFRDLDPGDPCFVAANRLAACGALPIDPREVDFGAQLPADQDWCLQIVKASRRIWVIPRNIGLPDTQGTRGEFCREWWQQVHELPYRGRTAVREDDFDGDGLADRDDALLFTPSEPPVFEIQPIPLTEDTDGRLPTKSHLAVLAVNFAGPHVPKLKDVQSDHGAVFSHQRGFGWERSLEQQHRWRQPRDATERDSFVFTREQDTWKCSLTNGQYRVTVCVGDSEHPQSAQRVQLQGQTVIDDVHTTSRVFHEETVDVEIRSGLLEMTVGSGQSGSNTCINWIYVERQ